MLLQDAESQRQMAVLQTMLTRKDQSIYKMTRDMNEIRADKDQLEKLFEGSQTYVECNVRDGTTCSRLANPALWVYRENQKCVQQINDLKEHVRVSWMRRPDRTASEPHLMQWQLRQILETTMNRLNGPGWRVCGQPNPH